MSLEKNSLIKGMGKDDSKKQQSSVWISMGLAVFGAVLSVIMNLF